MQQIIDSTSIHGIQHIFNKNSSRFARIFWVFILLCSICGFGFYLRSAYKKWQISPDISITTRERGLEDFPFPAVTICPNIFADPAKADISKIINLRGNSISNFTKTDCINLIANINWCSPGLKIALFNLKAACEKYLDEIEEIDYISVMNDTLPQLKIVVDGPKSLLVPTLTPYGICYTNNLQDFNEIFTVEIHDDFKGFYQSEYKSLEWTPELGYISKNSTYPPSLKALPKASYLIVLNGPESNNECLIKKSIMIFHLPNEVPTEYREHHDFFTVARNEMIYTKVIVKSYRNNMDLKDFPLEIRECYFENERKLKFFKFYSVNHCKLECYANITLAKFGCVKFFMPRDKNTKICKFSENTNVFNVYEDLKVCGCWPLCNDIKFDYKIEKFPDFFPSEFNKSLIFSHLLVYFAEESVEEVERFLGYKLQNFISDAGGLLGLFLGCSLISVVEIFFFLVRSTMNTFNGVSNQADQQLRERVEGMNSEIEKIKKNFENLREEIHVSDRIEVLSSSMYN